MTTPYQDRHHSPYNVKQLYDLVADVAHYPDFLPWVAAVRLLEQGKDHFTAEVVAKFKAFSAGYTCRVDLSPQREADETAHIEVNLLEGPFRYLENRWRFIPKPSGGTDIDFYIDFSFRSRMLQGMIGGLFERAVVKMVDAFEQRAKELYGY